MPGVSQSCVFLHRLKRFTRRVMCKIRDAAAIDIPGIIHVAEESWWPTYGKILPESQIRYMLDAIYQPEIIASQIENREQIYLVVQEKSECRGFASYGKQGPSTDQFKIHKLYVSPGQQRKGYGRMLLEEIVNRLRAEHVPFVDLNVNRYNPARSFYEHIGFRIIGQADIPVGPYWMNDYVMRLQL